MKSQLIDALIEVAEQRGFTVRWHRGGPKAAWLPQQNAVTLRHGMSDAETLCALAHELGHASATMTLDTYAALFDDDLEAVGARVGEVFSDVVEMSWRSS